MSSARATLLSWMDQSIARKEFDALSPEIQSQSDSLRQELAQAQAAYTKDLEAWKAKQFRGLLGDLQQEAGLDLDRFLVKYFLDASTGRPNRTNSTEALVINPPWEDVRGLRSAAREIPGLEVRHHKATHTVIIGWDAEVDRAVGREFAKLSDGRRDLASLELTSMFTLFLKKYFDIRVEDGSAVDPSEKKPPAQVVVVTRRFRMDHALDGFIKDMPGLSVRYLKGACWRTLERLGVHAGLGYSHIILGWDAGAVDIEVARVEAEIRREKEEEEAAERAEEAEEAAEQNKRWERISEPHRQYVARKTPGFGPLRLEDLPGSYIMRWDGEGGEYSYPYDPRDALRLDILEKTSAHGVKAAFKTGLWEGIMLLGMSRRSVELLREEQPKDGDDEEEDEDEDKENPFSRSDLHGAAMTGQKRQLGSVSDPWGVKATMAKRQKTEPGSTPASSNPNRVYLQFVCKEVNGYPDVDGNNEHIGWLDFDASKLSAAGSMSMPAYTEEPQLFTIYKVADKAVADVKDIREWREFDGRSWGGLGGRW
ncbi:hypothetical protein GE09DRAFT_1221354 [Coniochaeta sp. 2T2.1]|nr:hypothetical protein GE09DRAFT_1221354 [Coniochaeta sp. 2T2.1]